MRTLSFFAAFAVCAAVASNLHAQPAPSGTPAAQRPAPSAMAVPAGAPTGSADASSPVEQEGTTYRFVGARFRYIILPKFMMNLFGDGGTTVGIPAFGPEFGIRKNGFETILGLQYSIYSMDPTPFKASSDPDNAYEIVDASLKVLYVTADFLWSAPIDPKWQVLYGVGTGLGIVFGDIHRQQAYPPNGRPSDPTTYLPCRSVGNPDANYCGNDNNHYGSYTEPSWANGGSQPVIFPWLALQTGIRFKPTHDFAARFELGWNLLNGPFFGLAGQYGL